MFSIARLIDSGQVLQIAPADLRYPENQKSIGTRSEIATKRLSLDERDTNPVVFSWNARVLRKQFVVSWNDINETL
ncbi:hypothetical protein TNCV_5066071 [Trichonephila clavipes]|nr:hypothetical protein TNCV_5066071 [Trichonephila clavipes]